MSSAIDDYKFIVQKNDKLLYAQSKKTNIVIALIVLILFVLFVTAFAYNVYVKVNQVNIYPYNYNTEHGDYDLNYLVEQNYINTLSNDDLTKYLSLNDADKLTAIKYNIISKLT